MKKIFNYFKTGNISLVLIIPPSFGFLLIIIAAVLSGIWYPGGLPIKFTSILFFFLMLMISLSGYIQYYRSEMPGYFGKSIYGKYPKIIGVMMMIVSIIVGIYILILTFSN